jgi:uncharacterized cofD-like protein
MLNKKPRWYRRIFKFFQREWRWLTPGLGVKRWVLLILAGTTLVALGMAVIILDIYRNIPDSPLVPVAAALSLRFLERPLRAIVFGLPGLGLVVYGIWGLNRSLLKPFVRPGETLISTLSSYRLKERGPRVVVIGGGTGLSSLLRGIKHHTHNLTAIVTVADDGGSSGELRRNLGILPPGDIRNCLTALSDDEALLTQIFQYRFASSAGLGGHSFGNLFITALTDITGSFEKAIAESGRVLAVHGQVLPSTLHDVKLAADIKKADRELHVKGESQIPKTAGEIRRVWLEPNNPLAYPPAIQAILSAELIVIGPGSLYTSILPNLLVPDLAAAVRASRAMKVYVCNVAQQPGETDGYTCGDHIRTLEKHLGSDLFDLVLCNNCFDETSNTAQPVMFVRPEAGIEERYSIHFANLIDSENPGRHDSNRLAEVIMDLFYERTGPLSSHDETAIERIR